MANREGTIDRDDWLAHAAALRRLAAGLLRDEHEAEDLVQETWLRSRRSDAPKSGSWFRAVIRNLARDRMRERGRRAGTEREAARPERVPSAGEIGERLEVAQRLALEVARLTEPYRTVIHLRYFEGLGTEEIARLSGVPVETVRTRLRRGLETLRVRLDSAHGGRREAWALALAPLATRGGTAGGILATTGAIMSTKFVVTGVAAAVAAVGVFLAWQRLRTTGEHLDDSPRIGRETALSGDTELRSRIAGALAATREPGDPSLPVSPGSTGVHPAVEIRGIVVVEDEQGAEHAKESGKLTIAHATSDADAQFQEVDVTAGAWTASIPEGRLLFVTKLVARDREALLPEPRPIAVGPALISVRGKWLSRGWLRVVDANTKEELSGIEVRTAGSLRAGPQWTHPGDDPRMKAVVSDGVSPVRLPDEKWLVFYWVHAPGHAWTRVDFDHRAGGQRTVELSPEPSSVSVTIAGGDVPEGAFVRLYSRSKTFQDSGFTFRMPERPEHYLAAVSVNASSGSVRIDDFQGGEYVATVEVGEYEETLRLGEAPVDVPPGGTAAVSVPIDRSILDVPRTHLSGTLEVPEGLDRKSCRLRLQRIGGLQKDLWLELSEMSFPRGNENSLQWDAGLVRTGDYDAIIQNVEYSFAIHAPGPGETHVVTTLPQLAEVSLDVVDARTGARVEPERLQWRGPLLEGRDEFEMVPILRDPRTGRFRFVSTRGEIEVYGAMTGYKELQKKLVLDGPKLESTLTMERATGIRIVLRQDGAPLAGFGILALFRISREDGAAFREQPGITWNSTSIRYLDPPGRYRVALPPNGELEPVEPRIVDVREGEVVDVTIDVRQKN